MSKKKSDSMRTLDEIRRCEKDILVPEDIAGLLRCDSQTINMQAKADPAMLGFPVIVMGTRVRIPREGFVRFCEGAGLGL
jgi:hypothetical protein